MLISILLVQAAAEAPAGPQTAPGAQQPLYLTCLGGGTANKPTMATAWGNGQSVRVTGLRQQGFEEQVDIRLFAGDDRIRLPRTMLPGLRGGTEGWFKLKGVEATERSIKAKAAVNFINSPNVYIDRVTGTISISGKSGDYTGQCQVVDANAPAKF